MVGDFIGSIGVAFIFAFCAEQIKRAAVHIERALNIRIAFKSQGAVDVGGAVAGDGFIQRAGEVQRAAGFIRNCALQIFRGGG